VLSGTKTYNVISLAFRKVLQEPGEFGMGNEVFEAHSFRRCTVRDDSFSLCMREAVAGIVDENGVATLDVIVGVRERLDGLDNGLPSCLFVRKDLYRGTLRYTEVVHKKIPHALHIGNGAGEIVDSICIVNILGEVHILVDTDKQ
jgi:hypothetical protein